MRKIALLLDIGNTRSKYILTSNNDRSIDGLALQVIAHTELKQGLTNLQADLASAKMHVQSIVICNVSSLEILQMWETFFLKILPDISIQQFTASQRHPQLINQYHPITHLGHDRWAALFGAHQKAPEGNFLVVNSGTACTIDYVNQAHQFVGGWIIPGMDLMFESLGKKTAQLPQLHAMDAPPPNSFFGDNTQDAIFQGVIHAQLGAIQLAMMHTEPQTLLITGGNAQALANRLPTLLRPAQQCMVAPLLVLEGLHHWLQLQEQKES